MISVVLLIVIRLTLLDASHFRGGTINWKPTNIANEVEFRFKLGWTYGNGAGCNETLIGQYVTGGSESWSCTSGCPTVSTLSNTSYICTGASRSENWEQGEYTFRHQFHDKGPFTIGFSGCCWMSLNYGGSGNWNVQTVVDLRTRNDTKRINSSPISGSRPMYRLQHGCNNTLTLPMTDADGDIVKCRWSVGTECSSVCNGLPNATLDKDTCTISFHATLANQYIANGWYAVALTIEDYPRFAISIGGTTVLSSAPISSTPIQFLINTPAMNGSCDEKPKFVNNTPQEKQLIAVKAGRSLNIRFYAESKFGITDVTLMSPAGLQKSALLGDDLGRAGVSYIRVSWTPNQADKGAHLLCGTAEDTQEKMSVPRCMTILAWDNDPCDSSPCQNGGTCTRVGFTDDYTCICGSRFTGLLCETYIDPCNSSPCQNNGTCNSVGFTGGYNCVCSQYYSGVLCETYIDPCNSLPCQNNGTCNSVGFTGGYYCVCSQFYSGVLCETYIDPCNSSPCQNNGTCNSVGFTDDYTCVCSPRYTGLLCERYINPCDSFPCQNNGTCNSIGFKGDYNCVCGPGYTGVLCENRINHCRNSPCLHGGTCINHLTKYTCSCDESWYGHICEYINATSSETSNKYTDCKCVLCPMKKLAAKNRDVLFGFIGMLTSLSLVILTYYLRMRHVNNKYIDQRNMSAYTLYPDVAEMQHKPNLHRYR